MTELSRYAKLRHSLTRLREWISQLQSQAILLTILLLSLVLLLIIGVTILAYQSVSQVLAESRDQELARVSAERLSESMADFARGLKVLADLEQMKSAEPTLQEQTLEQGRELIAEFVNNDGGVIILDANGFVSVTRPFRPDLIGQNFSKESYFLNAKAFPNTTVFFSNILQEPGTNEDIIVISVPIINNNNEFLGVIAGRFYLNFQRLGQEIQKLKGAGESLAYLVDRNGRLIYHPVSTLIGTDFSQQQVVQQLQQGEQDGAITTQQEPRTVEGFAVVDITGWGLVITEPWSQAVRPATEAIRPVTAVLIAGIITVAVVVSIGVQRVTEPIQNLVTQTRQVSSGDYDAKVSLSRIKEIKELGMAFNEMVEQIGRYRAGMRQYVADITKSQEEERKRIARELHDDTVQSLIAINQRLDLAKTAIDDPEAVRTRLNEIRTMVTGAIASVRQFSRDLRPLALEDLGLIPAMQYQINQLMQQDSIEVNFSVHGEPGEILVDMEVAIYRILQETLNNVKKHAQATQVEVRANFTASQIFLTIEDNGSGFEMPEAFTDFAGKGSFGMLGLQERVQLFGGNLTVETEPEHGTKVHVVMPRNPIIAQFELKSTFAAGNTDTPPRRQIG